MMDGIPKVLPLFGSSDFFLSPDLWWTTGLLFGVLLVGAVVLSFVARWRDKTLSDVQEETGSIVSFKAMYENGELSEEEYKVIMERIAKKKSVRLPVNESPGPSPVASDAASSDSVIFTIGDKVRIKVGAFAGMEGEVRAITGNVVRAEVKVYGQMVGVDLEAGWMDKIT